MSSQIFCGFEPVFTPDSRVLILGSFPSVQSRKVGFYYGNKQNKFWKMLAQCFQENIGSDTKSKVEFLNRHRIALYDIVSSSTLSGSMDSALRKSKNTISDITFLLPPHTKVEKILCNGRAAYDLLQKSQQTTLPTLLMPSTSPANTRYCAAVWENALDFLKN